MKKKIRIITKPVIFLRILNSAPTLSIAKNWENTENIQVFGIEQILRHFLYL